MATAVSVWGALLAPRVSQLKSYGAVVSAAPRFAPSSLNCTLCTPTSSDALAVTDTMPDTVEPAAGAVTETVGGVVSACAVPLASPEGPEAFPAASAAITT